MFALYNNQYFDLKKKKSSDILHLTEEKNRESVKQFSPSFYISILLF